MSEPYTIDSLLSIMSQLRDPIKGCPWDRKQDWQSIVPYTLEEAYEVADAINHAVSDGNFEEVRLELGDLLFQVVFYAQFAKEQGDFEFADVVAGVCEKLVRRHPHVFDQADLSDEAAVKKNWEAEKAKERVSKLSANLVASVLDDVPHALPALSRAQKMQKRCATVGFDWPETHQVLDKVKEEVTEVEQEMRLDNSPALAEEIGDLLFSCVNLARVHHFDAEQLLRQANHKFEARFKQVEALAAEDGAELSQLSLQQMDALWEKVKESYKS